MRVSYPDVLGWVFDVDERSAGVYTVEAIDKEGRTISMEGNDPYDLLDHARRDALAMIKKSKDQQ